MTKSRNMRRAFTPEFKAEAVRLWEDRRERAVPIGRVAKELGVRPNQLREWASHSGAVTTTPSQGGESSEQELRRLRRENARLKQEAEFLKKAAAFFAKESQ
jgi:transposase-like protein